MNFAIGYLKRILYVCGLNLLIIMNIKKIKKRPIVIDNFISLRRCTK